MCQFSAENKDGAATDWHFVHYVSRAIGGAGLIIIEMTNVEPDGRITVYNLGLWSDEQIPALKRIVDACHKYGAKVAIQIDHAGRKAVDAAVLVAPSEFPYDEKSKTPRALSTSEVQEMVEKFRQAVLGQGEIKYMLTSSNAAIDFYKRCGFEKDERAFVIRRFSQC